MNPQAAQNYLRTRVLTATPEQLHLMLYDGAIRFAEQAKAAIAKRDWEGVYTNCSRAQKIMVEMSGGLKHGVAPEMCAKLAALYNFIYRRLVDASTTHAIEAVDEALELLRFQRQTWVMLMETLSKQKAGAAAAKIDMPAPDARMEAALCVQG